MSSLAQSDPEIPDARVSGLIFPIPAKSGFPIPRIRDFGQIGIPDFPKLNPNPGIPARAKSGFKSGKIHFFAGPERVIAHCQRQAWLLRFLIGVPGWEKSLIVQ
jgi:hypothetical protein